MMKDRIRGWTPVILLLLAVFLLAGCGTSKESRNLQRQGTVRAERMTDSAAVSADVAVTAVRKMQDLLADRRSSTLMQEPVPAQEATLTIPFQNLLDLPEGAGYRHRDGRASVDIRRQGDSLAVTGHCDSLMRRCLLYEEEVFRRQVREDSLLQTVEFYKQELVRIRSETEQRITEVETEFKQRFNPVKIALIAFIAGMASGIVLTVLIKRRLYEK